MKKMFEEPSVTLVSLEENVMIDYDIYSKGSLWGFAASIDDSGNDLGSYIDI